MSFIRACVFTAFMAAAGLAQAQGAPASSAEDSSLTWKGITLYGIVDIGVQYQTHGVPASDYFPAGTEAIIQKNSNHSVTAVTPSNLSQSRIGLAGKEPLIGDWSGVFRLETFFNPQSGDISDGLKSQVLNNGKGAAAQGTNVDTSVAGQLFAGAAYAGFSSPSIGSFTFGRHVTPLADGIAKYDPAGASQAFSLIGFSGTTAGGGDTEDRRLDESLKYTGKYGPLHLGALYQFSGSRGTTNTAVQATVGADVAGFSVDAYYAKKYDAITTSPLNADMVAGLPVAGFLGPSLGFSTGNSLAGTVSDNTTFAIMALYNFGGPTFYAAYEHVKFANPTDPLPAGYIDIGGYVLAYVKNTAYDNEKILEIFWGGVKWPVTPDFDLVAAYYGYHQDAFATGANAGCSTSANAACSGNEHSASIYGDYRLSKRFDVYLGTFWTDVQNGLANGYDLNRATITTTMGLRFKF
jgi:predicted porin